MTTNTTNLPSVVSRDEWLGAHKDLLAKEKEAMRARAQLIEHGVEVSEVQVMGESPSLQDDPLDNVGFFFFNDPDGNGWAVQQISTRA